MCKACGFDNEELYSGFIFGYTIPQLNKEFDLLKITESKCINIELKSKAICEDKIKKQLLLNKHYLRLLKKELQLITFVKDTNTFYILSDDETLSCFEPPEVLSLLKTVKHGGLQIDLNDVFSPKNVLVSPLNSPERFIENDYILTDHQQIIEKQILDTFNSKTEDVFFGLTGGPGTGKTLLLYDVAKKLAVNKKVLIIHCGYLCDGHSFLQNRITNLFVISVKALRMREIKNVDVVLVDESHRIYPSHLEKVERWVKKSKAKCLFSFDESQRLSHYEYRINSLETIQNLCGTNIQKLTNKIRTNKEIATFISKMRNLSKHKGCGCFPNVRILFEPSKTKAVQIAKILEQNGYTFISYTTSSYYQGLDYQETDRNTHAVIGQEFDKVVMTLPDYFYYDGNILKAKDHPNPNYMLEQLLYQGLTRARTSIALIVETEENLYKILSMFE